MGRCLVEQASRGLCRFQGRTQTPAPEELFLGAILEDQVWEPSASCVLQTGQGIPRKLWLRLSWVISPTDHALLASEPGMASVFLEDPSLAEPRPPPPRVTCRALQHQS